MQLDVFAEAIWGLDSEAKIARAVKDIPLPTVYVLVNGIEMPVLSVTQQGGKVIVEGR